MLSKPSCVRYIAACSVCAVLFTAQALASNALDRPFTSSAAAKPAGNDQKRATGKDFKAIQLAKAEKARQAEKNAQRRIVTYKLFHDPVFKLEGAINDKRQFITSGRLGANALPGAVNKMAPDTALKLDDADNAATAFGCRERPFSTTAAKRELSACFAHKLDKSWKAQTYVTKGYTEGNQNWGGGLAVGYHY